MKRCVARCLKGIAIVYLMIVAVAYFMQDRLTRLIIKTCLHTTYSIHQACFSYAQAHDQEFPDGKSSNEAYRQLFVADYIDDEKLFSRGRSSDGNIGTKENGYKEAVGVGETNFYYVRGLHPLEADWQKPLVFTRLPGGEGEVYVVVAHVGGNATAYKTVDGIFTESDGTKVTNFFSKEYLHAKYGIDPKDVLEPEGPRPLPSGQPRSFPSALLWWSLIPGAYLLWLILRRFLPRKQSVVVS